MQRALQVLLTSAAVFVAAGCVNSDQAERKEMTPLERAAIEEAGQIRPAEAPPRASADIAQTRATPGPMPSEPSATMTGPDPSGMESDRMKKQVRDDDGPTPFPEEPESARRR